MPPGNTPIEVELNELAPSLDGLFLSSLDGPLLH